jgi:hypothetical protein
MSEPGDRPRLHPERIRLAISDPEGTPLPSLRNPRVPLAGWIVLVALLGGAAAFTIVARPGSFGQILRMLLGVAATIALLALALRLMARESAGILGRRLYHTFRLGPFRLVREYDLAKVRAVELMGMTDETSAVRFSYDGMPATLPYVTRDHARTAYLAVQEASNEARAAQVPANPLPPAPPFSWKSLSLLSLVAANLVPVIGVTALGWDLGTMMVLYWAESGVIGLFNVLKMLRVGGFAGIPIVVFFLVHFGGFMLVHFVFTYALFVEPALKTEGAYPVFAPAVADLFLSLWPALLALFISHGISYRVNFVGRREFVGRTLNQQMGQPYARIFIMHIAIILGAAAMKGGHRLAPLYILIGLKTGVDLWSHWWERKRASNFRLQASSAKV